MAYNMSPMDEVDRKRALLQWSRLMGIPLKLVRLDSDAIELAHHTDDMAEVSISVRSIRDDT
jgi:hypothetical protein